MATEEGSRANWKDPDLVKLFIELCLEEVNTIGKKGSTLQKDSWNKIAKKIMDKKGINMTQKQLRNEWDYLKKKYMVWSAIIGKTGHGYNPVTNTVNWDATQWDDYIKAVPEAKQFRHVGLQYSDELRALFDGITATGQGGWGPSKEGLSADCIGSSSFSQVAMGLSHIHIDLDSQSPNTLTSCVDMQLPKEKRRKQNNPMDLDSQVMKALKTLEKSDGPSIDECNNILDEMQNLQMEDPLYIVATGIFCESKAYREQWMKFSDKPETVKLKWIEVIGKKLGLI